MDGAAPTVGVSVTRSGKRYRDRPTDDETIVPRRSTRQRIGPPTPPEPPKKVDMMTSRKCKSMPIQVEKAEVFPTDFLQYINEVRVQGTRLLKYFLLQYYTQYGKLPPKINQL